jgi:LmbE family N-acetylglucosaminyl deacetylase
MRRARLVNNFWKRNLRLSFILAGIACLNIFFVSLVFASAKPLKPTQTSLPPVEEITKNDRVLILAPHPDDEAIACAGIIQKAIKAGADLHVVFLTNGDHNQFAFIVYEKRLVFRKGEYLHMGKVRREESIKAMQILGLTADKLTFLGYPDFGTMAIFKNYWNVDRPFKSLLTRVSSVPYKEDFSFGKPYIGESILFDLEEVLRRYKPNKIFVTHPADVNSDHRALSLFLQVALWDLKAQLSTNLKVYSYLVHHKGWPLPRHFHPQLALTPPKDMQEADIKWQVLNLDSTELEKKHQAILSYRSQTASSAFYLLSFARANELFGNFSNIALVDLNKSDQIIWSEHPDLLWEKVEEESWAEEGGAPSGSQIDYAVKDKKLYIKLTLKKQPIVTDLLFFLFGYKDSVGFRDMPKIRLKIMGETVRLSDKKVQLDNNEIYRHVDGKNIIIGVPLKILNDPQYILTSVYASSRGVSSEAASWRVIELK